MSIPDKRFAVTFKVGHTIDYEEMILHSSSKYEARKYCDEWASFIEGTKVWKIREIKL
jgi:hypothetical protein